MVRYHSSDLGASLERVPIRGPFLVKDDIDAIKLSVAIYIGSVTDLLILAIRRYLVAMSDLAFGFR